MQQPLRHTRQGAACKEIGKRTGEKKRRGRTLQVRSCAMQPGSCLDWKVGWDKKESAAARAWSTRAAREKMKNEGKRKEERGRWEHVRGVEGRALSQTGEGSLRKEQDGARRSVGAQQ